MSTVALARRGRGAAAVAMLLALPVCGEESSFKPLDDAGNYEGTLTSDDVKRTYTVHTPPTWGDGTALPLLIALHGVPGNGNLMRVVTGLDDVADRDGFVVAYPNAVHIEWAMGCDCTRAEFEGVSDVRFISKLIDELASRLKIDRARVFIAGYSQGALMTHFLGCRLADRLAGAASVAATMLSNIAAECQPSRSLPTLFIHGSEDREFPPQGRVGESTSTISIDETVERWVDLNGCSDTPELVAEPDTADDGTVVQRATYSGCHPGGRVVYYSVEGGGHTWPGMSVAGSGTVSRDINASDVISRFFLR